MKLIKREFYLSKLVAVMGTPDIKVITGVRRSGKSKLLEAFKTYLEETIPASSLNIIHVNFNLPEFKHLCNSDALYEYAKKCHDASKENFILIDEVQMCTDFETVVNGLHVSEKFDIYITGSNAFLLSSDLATLFTGRTFEIKVYPFSFAEYLRYFESPDRQEAFDRYLLEGGMSGSYLYKDENAKYDYISDVFNTLIVRDICKKYKIRNVPLLERVVDFMTDNVSNLSSVRKIKDSLLGVQESVSHVTIGTYIQRLCQAFAFYKIRRYDIRGRKYLASSDKYYLCDHTFRYARLGIKNMDYGRMIENVVAIELLRRGYEVYAGVLYKKEIDFVALKRNEKIYIQVSDDITSEVTLNREVTPLLRIKDAYPKMLISRTRHPKYLYEGIEIVDVANWLAAVTLVPPS